MKDPDHQTLDSNTPATMSAKDETEKDSSPLSPANVQAKEEKKPAPPAAAAAAAHQAAGDGRVQGPQPSRWAALKSGPSEGSGRRLSFGKTTTFVNSSIREAEEQRRRHSMGNKEARAKNILRPKLASVGARDAPDGLAKNGTGTGKNAQQGANCKYFLLVHYSRTVGYIRLIVLSAWLILCLFFQPVAINDV